MLLTNKVVYEFVKCIRLSSFRLMSCSSLLSFYSNTRFLVWLKSLVHFQSVLLSFNHPWVICAILTQISSWYSLNKLSPPRVLIISIFDRVQEHGICLLLMRAAATRKKQRCNCTKRCFLKVTSWFPHINLLNILWFELEDWCSYLRMEKKVISRCFV